MAVLGGQGTLRNLETEEKLEISWFQAGEETLMTEMKTWTCSWLKKINQQAVSERHRKLQVDIQDPQ